MNIARTIRIACCLVLFVSSTLAEASEVDQLTSLLGSDSQQVRDDAAKQLRETALHFAAKNGSPKCVRLLLDAGADRAATNASGDTPLAEAERYQHQEVIQLLRAATH